MGHMQLTHVQLTCKSDLQLVLWGLTGGGGGGRAGGVAQ